MIIQRVPSDRLPSPHGDHVLIERSPTGAFHVSGCARQAGAIKHLDLPLFDKLDAAIEACQPFADQLGILIIHVHAPMN